MNFRRSRRQHNLEKPDHGLCQAAGFFDGQNLRFRNFHVATSFGSYQHGLVTILQKCPSDAQFDSPEAQLHYYRSTDPRLKCAPHRFPRVCLFSTRQASTLAKAINTVRNDRYCALTSRTCLAAASGMRAIPRFGSYVFCAKLRPLSWAFVQPRARTGPQL